MPAYWIDEFHLDGLRLDATQQMFDASATHVLADISRRARAAAPERSIILVAENEPQDVRLLRPHRGGRIRLRRPVERRLSSRGGGGAHGASRGVLHGLLRQRRRNGSRWRSGDSCIRASGTRGRRAGAARPPVGSRPCRVHHLSGESRSGRECAYGPRRAHSIRVPVPGIYRALTALWLLSPGTPMFFQGQEFASSSPFLYFADHGGPLGAAVRAGRAEFMSQFQSTASRDLVDALPDPADEDDLPPVQAASCRAPARTRRPSPFTAICCGCAARIRSSATRVPAGWTAPSCRIGRSSCDGLRAIRAGRGRRSSPPAIGWWSSISELTCISFRAGAAAGAARRHHMGDPVVERRSARMEAPARLLWRPRRAGAFPVRRLSCSPRVGYEPSFSTNLLVRVPTRRRTRAVNGSSRTVSAAMPPAPSPASSTRRYHGLLVSALPAPIGRTVMLSAVDAWVRLPSGQVLALDPDPPGPAGVEREPAEPAPEGLESLETNVTCRIPARGRPARLVLRRRGTGHREAGADAVPAEHGASDLPADRGSAAVRLELRPFMHVRHYESRSRRAAEPVRPDGGRQSVRRASRGRSSGAASPDVRGRSRRLPSTGRRPLAAISKNSPADTNIEGSLWSPGYFHVNLGLDPSRVGGHARRVDRIVGNGRGADTRSGVSNRDDPPRADSRAGARSDALRSVRGTGARRRSVSRHAGRAPGRRDACRGARNRGAHGDRRLSLVHRLGAGHDDQPRGADAHHRPRARSRPHPSHLRELRARRADSQHVPGRRAPGPVSHRRCDALVLSRGGTLRVAHPRRRHASHPAPRPSRHRRSPCAWHAIRHRRRSGRRPAAAGRSGIPADVDGCQGGRLGGHATARKGGGDQRPVLQRALPARRVGAGANMATEAARPLECAGRSGCAKPSTAASGTKRGGTFTTWWTAKRETMPPAVRISCWPSRCLIRFSTKTAGGRCSKWSTTDC